MLPWTKDLSIFGHAEMDPSISMEAILIPALKKKWCIAHFALPDLWV